MSDTNSSREGGGGGGVGDGSSSSSGVDAGSGGARNVSSLSTQLSSANTTPSEQVRLNKLQKQRPHPLGQPKADGDRTGRPSELSITSSPLSGGGMAVPNRLGSSSPSQIIDPYRRTGSPFSGSPGRHLQSASPRHLSPATSMIFERDVQESTVASELSPAIPSHVQIEDHIPPVLEASSLAITDTKLDPDEVEIVTHSAHLPASLTVTGSGLSESSVLFSHSLANDSGIFQEPQQHDETGSAYGNVDPSDPRRLSFISFADVVHAEQVETGAPSSLHGGQSSPSPVRSPVSMDRVPISSPLSGSPPAATAAAAGTAGAAAAAAAFETSPTRGGPGSVASGYGHGELNVETMRQTMESVASNDLSSSTGGLREPLSATASEYGHRIFK